MKYNAMITDPYHVEGQKGENILQKKNTIKTEKNNAGRDSSTSNCYIPICERCKFLRYEERQISCSQGHWYGDDDPDNQPERKEDDLWADCKEYEGI